MNKGGGFHYWKDTVYLQPNREPGWGGSHPARQAGRQAGRQASRQAGGPVAAHFVGEPRESWLGLPAQGPSMGRSRRRREKRGGPLPEEVGYRGGEGGGDQMFHSWSWWMAHIRPVSFRPFNSWERERERERDEIDTHRIDKYTCCNELQKLKEN